MKIIQCISDIEAIRAFGEIPLVLVEEIEEDFLGIYEMENSEQDVLQFRLPMGQALFVLDKGDNVLAKLDQPLELEYVERLEVGDVAYFRCAIRTDHEFQLYYSVVGTHDQGIEDWLSEQSQDGE